MTALPDWPRLMRRQTAALYLDMSEAAFEREVLAGKMPAAIVIGGKDHWSRAAIDGAIARLTGESEPDYRRQLRERYNGKAA